MSHLDCLVVHKYHISTEQPAWKGTARGAQTSELMGLGSFCSPATNSLWDLWKDPYPHYHYFKP